MKRHITIKEAKKIADYGVGYYNLQYLFNCLEPFAYTATKTYGWRADLYQLGGVIISTGYAPQGEIIPYELTQKYENLAIKVISDYPAYNDRKEKLDNLIDEFLTELEAQKMESCCENCLVCYLDEYTQVKVKDNIILECSAQIPDTKENREGIKKAIEKYK